MRNLALFLVLLIASCYPDKDYKKSISVASGTQDSLFVEYLDRKFDELLHRNPEFAANLGLKYNYSAFSPRTVENWENELKISQLEFDSLKLLFNVSSLNEENKLTYRMLEEELKQSIEDKKWWDYGYAINQLGGEHNDLPGFMINIHSIDTLQDAFDYISRVKAFPTVLQQTITNIKRSAEKGITPPAFTFPYVTADIENFILGTQKTTEENILLFDFTSKVKECKSISDSTKNSLINQLKTILITEVKPAYENLLVEWKNIESKANGNKGVWNLPNGKEYYAACLRDVTTTTMTPDEIFELGKKEVARIESEMKEIMKKVGYKNDSTVSFFNYLRTDATFKYEKNDAGRKALISESENYINNMRPKLAELFQTMPKAPVVVKQVEKFREQSAGGAFYENPSLDGSRPGRFYVNTFNMDDEPRYQMEALCYHEAIPGHHMQIAIAQELQGLPMTRKFYDNVAYIEGWALYSELLPKEIGFYQDPYSDFGRLSMEIFRAARLVVDVGIHYKQWTREQAIAYMLEHTANAEGDVRKEVERYFLWPAQATGYKIGMIKILQLREKAKKELGNKFDIKGFHDVILTHGAVPLKVLEELVDSWISKTKNE